MKLTVRLSDFPVSRFAAPLLQLEAAARAALLGRLVGSRTDRAASVPPQDKPVAPPQPPDPTS